jgi:hypothetical protein
MVALGVSGRGAPREVCMKQSIVSAAALLCAGCALGVPAGVRVKTAPAIRVSSGGATITLDDYLSAEILDNLLGGYSNAKYYQYVPENDKNTLHILVRYPLMNVGIPSKEYLEEYENLKEYLVGENIIDEDDPIDFDSSELIELGVIEKIQSIEGINLAKFAHELPENLGFKSVAAKIYAGPYAGTEETQYKLYGSISANYWQEYARQKPETVVLLGNKENDDISPDTMVFKGNPPTLTGNQNGVLSPNEADNYAKLTSSLPKEGEGIELRDIFNCRPDKLDFCFDVVPQIGDEPGRIAFTVEEIKNTKSLQFTADMVLDISLAFVATTVSTTAPGSYEPVVMRLDKIPGIDADSERDIFEQTKESDFFDGVQTVTLRLHYDNSLISSDEAAEMRVGSEYVCAFTLKTGAKQTSEVVLDAGYVRNNPLRPKDIELAFIPEKDGALFSFAPGADGTGGSFTLTGVEVETALDRTFPF